MQNNESKYRHYAFQKNELKMDNKLKSLKVLEGKRKSVSLALVMNFQTQDQNTIIHKKKFLLQTSLELKIYAMVKE